MRFALTPLVASLALAGASGCSLVMDFSDEAAAGGDVDALFDPDMRDGAPLPQIDADPNADAVFQVPDAFSSDAAVRRETTRLTIVRDTYVRENNPSFNYGVDEKLCTDQPADFRTALLQPDLMVLPVGAVVEAAEIHLWTGPDTNDYSTDAAVFYEVLETWNEGSVDAAAGTASWNLRQGTTAWAKEGCGPGSRGTLPIGAFVPGALDTEYAVALDPALFNKWLADPATDHGIALVESTVDAACFMSTEGGGATRAPFMMVTWRLPVEGGVDTP